jgi:MFS superfamily sulfate permease-like transporter
MGFEITIPCYRCIKNQTFIKHLGLALSALIGLPPVNGLYVSLFPPLMYWIFGTSRQLSLGTDSIIALLTATAIQNLEGKFVPPLGFNSTNSTGIDTAAFLSHDRTTALILLAQTLTFFVAIIQLGMFVLQLGFLSIYLSDPLIGAFTSGAAIHIVTAQLGNMFGFHISEHSGIFRVPKVKLVIFLFSNFLVPIFFLFCFTGILRFIQEYKGNEWCCYNYCNCIDYFFVFN